MSATDPRYEDQDENSNGDALTANELDRAQSTLETISKLLERWHKGAPYTTTLLAIEAALHEGGYKTS